MKSHAIFTCTLVRIISLALLALFCLFACDDIEYEGIDIACSMNMDGSAFRFESMNAISSNSRAISPLYYLSDDLIIYSDSNNIYKRKLESVPIIIASRAPNFLERSLAIDAEAKKVYFIDVDGIYECGFDSYNRQQLLAGPGSSYKFLSLSENKRYLLSTKHRNIIRIDLETGENLSIESPHTLSKVWYNSALDRYFGYSTGHISMFWMENDDFHNIQLSLPEFNLADNMLRNTSDHSSDLRYFAIRGIHGRTMIYDLMHNAFQDIGTHGYIAFLQGEHRFLASSSIHGMYDVRLYDAESLNATTEMNYELIFDGIFANKNHLRRTEIIYPRWDGEKFFLFGFMKHKRGDYS